MPTEQPPTLTDGVVTLRPSGAGSAVFDVVVDEAIVGEVGLRDVGARTGDLTWALDEAHRRRGYATRAVRLLVQYAFAPSPEGLGLGRVQARVHPDDARSIRLARRSGLRNEGQSRAAPNSDEGDHVLLARLLDDPAPGDRTGFRALLNSFLPRKRVIAQALVRDPSGRVLLCHPTYKDDWDLPGGVVEVLESPRDAARREVQEELALDLPVDALVLDDWLPPWGGWDDALVLVFDAGVHDPSMLEEVVLQAREIRDVAFCTVEQAHARCADYTARRVEAALAALRGAGPAYTESGRSFAADG